MASAGGGPPPNAFPPDNDDENDPFFVGQPITYDPFLDQAPDYGATGGARPPPGYPGEALKRSRAGRFTDVTVAIVLPWLVFFLVVSLFLFAYHELGTVVWVLIALCSCLALLFLALGVCARHGLFLAIGFLCLTSVAMGTGVGWWLKTEYLERYWELEAGKDYTGVDPLGSDANRTRDAAVLRFVPGTVVDERRTLGFVVRGGMLCVAPVVAPSQTDAIVHYWAVGEDCCEQRSKFDCGTAMELDATTAVVEKLGSVYAKAVLQAMSVYGLKTTKDAMLVSFVSDPSSVINDIWDEALTIALIAMVMDLCMCGVAGLVISRIISVGTRQAAHGGYDRIK